MPTVYQHQLHAHKTRRPHPWRWLFILVVLGGGGIWYGLSQLESETFVSAPETVTKQIDVDAAVDSYQKGAFSIELPKGWQFMSKEQNIYTIYRFRSTLSGDAGNRFIDIYEDSELPKFAINRMVPVVANEQGGLTTDTSQVSENCTAYTTGTLSGSTVGKTAKWQGIEFNCDMGNTLRNVVGTGSKDGLNTVFVKTPTSRQHKYFFTYTDNNITPDFSIFTKALNSFKVIE
jgi:hypothetical protein